MKQSTVIIVLVGILVLIGIYLIVHKPTQSVPAATDQTAGTMPAGDDQMQMDMPMPATDSTAVAPASASSVSASVGVQTPASSSMVAVAISNFAFSPASITVKKGTTVTWTNNDSVDHTVTGDTAGPVSQNIAPGTTYSYTFNTTGTFAYHCAIHPSMHGSVTVTE